MLWELASSVHRALVVIGTAYLISAVAIAIIICVAAFFLIRMFVKFVQFRCPRQVLCPETGDIGVIRIKAFHAAVTSAVSDPDLRVSDCSFWPEHQGCREDCVYMISRNRSFWNPWLRRRRRFLPMIGSACQEPIKSHGRLASCANEQSSPASHRLSDPASSSRYIPNSAKYEWRRRLP